MPHATGVSYGYLLPQREPERRLTPISDVLQRIVDNITVVEPTPPCPTVSDVEPIRIEAELGRASTNIHKAAEFRIWSICHHLTRIGDGSGVISKKALKSALARFGISYTRQHLNHLLRIGIGIFWDVSKRSIFIRSRQTVAVNLGQLSPTLFATNRPGNRDMYVSPAGSLEQWEAMIYAAWLMYRQDPTISREQLETLFNRDQNTLRRWEQTRLENIIQIKPNYAQVDLNRLGHITPPADSQVYTAKVFTSAGVEYVTRLFWRLPNTYSVSGIRQHPRKGQARKVRATVNEQFDYPADQRHGGTHNQKRYFTSGDHLRWFMEKHALICYLWRGANKRWVGFWELSMDGFGVTRPGERIMNRS